MGGGGYVSFGYSEEEKPEEKAKRLRIPIEEQCGIIACSMFSGKTVKQVVSVAKKIGLYDRISKYEEKDARKTCLYCKDIKGIMKALGYENQDCRFCSFRRDTGELLPMPTYVNGIVALKLDASGDLTHWVTYKDGKILDGEYEFATVKELKKRYKTFDGFGIKLSIWSKEDFDILQNTMAVYCKSCSIYDGAICKNCSRKSFCVERRIFSKLLPLNPLLASSVRMKPSVGDLSNEKCDGMEEK